MTLDHIFPRKCLVYSRACSTVRTRLRLHFEQDAINVAKVDLAGENGLFQGRQNQFM